MGRGRILTNYYEEPHANKWKNLKADRFLNTNNLPKLNHEDIEDVTKPVTKEENESVIKKFPAKS